jgi:hypothetical protein
MIEINGMAHVILTVSQSDKARAFIEVVAAFGMAGIRWTASRGLISAHHRIVLQS